MLAWKPDWVESPGDLDEGILFAKRLGLPVVARTATLDHSWILMHDEWDYELITPEQATDAQELDDGAVIIATLLVQMVHME